jgi:Asp-tRNA(Asn)/Glu-tRNA(Gln) amidotransferase A subunit family amidase
VDDLGIPVETSDSSLCAQRWRAVFYDMMMADRYATGGPRFYKDPEQRAMLTDYGVTHFARAARVTGAQSSHSLCKRAHAIRLLEDLMADADVLLTPTVGMVAPELAADNTRIPDDARLPYVAHTFIVNYTGFAAATVPCGFVDGLPVGL